jgi:hypothetical protein
MPDYIVCRKKRNNPRMDIRICEKRCPFKEECKDFRAHHETPSSQNEIAPPLQPPSIELDAA